jgi:AcrR family transcriptional regulator
LAGLVHSSGPIFGLPAFAIFDVTNREAKSSVRGRPRAFRVDGALASALRVFWSKGYERASLTDLTDAMGITRPSLYAAFGNKEALFRKALDLYQREKIAYVEDALAQPTARQVAETLLRGALDNYCDPGEPRGWHCQSKCTPVSYLVRRQTQGAKFHLCSCFRQVEFCGSRRLQGSRRRETNQIPVSLTVPSAALNLM